MSLWLFMDVHVPRSITEGLRRRGVDVLTAQEDGSAELADPALLRRATELRRVLFTQDADLLREAARLQRHGQHFGGIVFAAQLAVTVGQCVQELELIAKVYEPSDIANAVERLPLK